MTLWESINNKLVLLLIESFDSIYRLWPMNVKNNYFLISIHKPAMNFRRPISKNKKSLTCSLIKL